MDYLQHLYNQELSAFYVNEKGQLSLPNHDYPKMEAIFNKLVRVDENIYFGFSTESISQDKGW